MTLNKESIEYITRYRTGRELVERVYGGTRTRMLDYIHKYRILFKNGDIDAATRCGELAIAQPSMGFARIAYAIDTYGRPEIEACLLAHGPVKIEDMEADTLPFIEYCNELKLRIETGESWDSVLTELESNLEYEAKKWRFPLPPNYLDIWGK